MAQRSMGGAGESPPPPRGEPPVGSEPSGKRSGTPAQIFFIQKNRITLAECSEIYRSAPEN